MVHPSGYVQSRQVLRGWGPSQLAVTTVGTHLSGFAQTSNVSTPKDEVHLFQTTWMDLLPFQTASWPGVA